MKVWITTAALCALALPAHAQAMASSAYCNQEQQVAFGGLVTVCSSATLECHTADIELYMQAMRSRNVSDAALRATTQNWGVLRPR
jgi:hypothetical protein